MLVRWDCSKAIPFLKTHTHIYTHSEILRQSYAEVENFLLTCNILWKIWYRLKVIQHVSCLDRYIPYFQCSLWPLLSFATCPPVIWNYVSVNLLKFNSLTLTNVKILVFTRIRSYNSSIIKWSQTWSNVTDHYTHIS